MKQTFIRLLQKIQKAGELVSAGAWRLQVWLEPTVADPQVEPLGDAADLDDEFEMVGVDMAHRCATTTTPTPPPEEDMDPVVVPLHKPIGPLEGSYAARFGDTTVGRQFYPRHQR